LLDSVVKFCGYTFNNSITLSFIQLLKFVQWPTFYLVTAHIIVHETRQPHQLTILALQQNAPQTLMIDYQYMNTETAGTI